MRTLKIFFSLAIGLFLMGGTAFAQQPGVPNSPNRGTSTISKPGSNASVGDVLRYANSLFDRYNNYNSLLNVDMLNNEVVFTNDFSELRAYFGAMEFRRDGENMGLFCKSGDLCISDRDVETREIEDPRSQYTFGIKQDGVAVPEMDGLIVQLNNMLADLTAQSGGSYTPSAPAVSAVVKRNLQVINDAFSRYNGYETVFSVQGKKLKWESTVATVSADIAELTFYINYNNKWMVMKCVDGDCLEGSSSTNDYSMGLKTSGGSIAPNILEVLEAFNNIRHDVLVN